MSSAGASVVEAPRTDTMTLQVSTGVGAVLNPEASVFQLPPSTTPTSTTAPTTPTTAPQQQQRPPSPTPPPPAAVATTTTSTTATSHINGYTHNNIHPFMNGDVAPECCGVVCPATPEDAPTSVGVPGSTALLQEDATGKAAPTKGAAGVSEAVPSPGPTSPLENGEMTPNGSGGQSASSPAPPSPTPSTTAAAATEGLALAPSSETQGTQTTPSQTPTPGSPPTSSPATPAPGQIPPPPPPVQPLSREQIKQLVAQQVEYFFSRENLSSDPYLISQMDSDQYVPVYILANCTQFKTITKDHSIIVEALKESPFVQLDEERNRVRPNYKRCIVILREIPESTPIEEIESVFKSEECPKVVSCEFVHNSSWYVTFESDEDAQKAYWYLRGVVKTFKDKPILARIKTKPMSRLGCLSVLPSCVGKAGGGTGEAKEGQGSATGPPSTQPSPGAAAGGGRSGAPGTPGPPGGSYNLSGGAQRFMFSTQQSVNPGSFTYTYSTPSSPMPPAYFYPNVMQWTPPGGFYDINSFLQFNGLSPQGTFTPQNHGPNLRYPPGRRNTKHRDGGRYDKGEGRQGGQGNPPGHYPRPHHHHHRPHPAPSPSQGPPHRPPSQAPSSASTPPPPPPPPPPASSGGAPAPPHPDSFAQSDFPLTSQPGLYTSFSPPAAPDKEVVTVSKPPLPPPATATSAANAATAAPTPPPLPSQSPPVASTASAAAAALPQDGSMAEGPAITLPPAPHPHQQPPLPPHLHPPPHPRHNHNPHPHHHHHHHHPFPPPHHLPQGMPGPPPPPPPHRHGNYPPDHFHHPHPHHHPPHLHQQGPRPVFDDRYPYYPRHRNLRRRPRGREDEAMGGPGRGGPPQRGNGPPHQPPGGPDGNKQGGPGSQEGAPAPPPPPPQFDLEAASFPPLPGSDEPAVVVVERRAADPLPSAWGDTQRFSDVMKGGPKPRPASLGDTPAEAAATPTTTTTTSSSTTTTLTPVGASTTTSTTTIAPNATSTTSTNTASPTTPTAAPTVPALPTPSTTTTTSTTAAATTQQPSHTTNTNISTAAAVAAPPTTTTTVNTTSTSNSSTAPPQPPSTMTTTTTPPASIDHSQTHQQPQTPTPIPTLTPTPTATTVTTAQITAAAPKTEPRPAPRDQRPTERRPAGVGGSSNTSTSSGVGVTNGPRERREFTREYPQRSGAGREFRGNRDPTLRTGKENRPIRPPREDKMDADGWITKGSRESRAQRESREQWERGESSSSSSSNTRHNHHNNNNNNNNNHHHQFHHHHHHHHHHLVNGDSASPPSSPKPQKGESSTTTSSSSNKLVSEECTEEAKGLPTRPLNNNDGEHKTSWAKMALASKDHMERLAAELKEKEEQEKIKKQRLATRPQPRPQEKVVQPRERDGKLLRRDAPPRDLRGLPGERGGPIPFRPRDAAAAATPKSPK